jgi:hypothetical protein
VALLAPAAPAARAAGAGAGAGGLAWSRKRLSSLQSEVGIAYGHFTEPTARAPSLVAARRCCCTGRQIQGDRSDTAVETCLQQGVPSNRAKS